MPNFILKDNFTNEVLVKLENWELSDIVYAGDYSDEEQPSDWFTVYHVTDTATIKDAVYFMGHWYEADGITPLNV